MLASFDGTICALMPDWPDLPADERKIVSTACARAARAQLARAPFHIRTGFSVLFQCYRVYALLVAGPFAGGNKLSRAVVKFSALPLPMVAGLERVLRATTMLAYLEHRSVTTRIGEEASSDRLAVFRTRRASLQA